jgi:hypothetical protein
MIVPILVSIIILVLVIVNFGIQDKTVTVDGRPISIPDSILPIAIKSVDKGYFTTAWNDNDYLLVRMMSLRPASGSGNTQFETELTLFFSQIAKFNHVKDWDATQQTLALTIGSTTLELLFEYVTQYLIRELGPAYATDAGYDSGSIWTDDTWNTIRDLLMMKRVLVPIVFVKLVLLMNVVWRIAPPHTQRNRPPTYYLRWAPYATATEFRALISAYMSATNGLNHYAKIGLETIVLDPANLENLASRNICFLDQWESMSPEMQELYRYIYNNTDIYYTNVAVDTLISPTGVPSAGTGTSRRFYWKQIPHKHSGTVLFETIYNDPNNLLGCAQLCERLPDTDEALLTTPNDNISVARIAFTQSHDAYIGTLPKASFGMLMPLTSAVLDNSTDDIGSASIAARYSYFNQGTTSRTIASDILDDLLVNLLVMLNFSDQAKTVESSSETENKTKTQTSPLEREEKPKEKEPYKKPKRGKRK